MEMVKVNLTNSYGYRLPDGQRRYYGPGHGILVPIGLARTLGLDHERVDAPQGGKEAAAAAASETGSSTGLAPLPEGFPGRRYLVAAGYTTYESLSGQTQDDLVAIKGIGEATAEAILLNLPKEGEATGEERTGIPAEPGETATLES